MRIVAWIIIMFFLVAVLPICRRRENLWLFILCAVVSVPINYGLLTEYELLRRFFLGESAGILYILNYLQFMLIFTGIEEVMVGFTGRLIWPKQYKLWFPETEEL